MFFLNLHITMTIWERISMDIATCPLSKAFHWMPPAQAP